MSHEQSFLLQAKQQNIEVVKVEPIFPYQNGNGNAYEVEFKNTRTYFYFNEDGKCIQRKGL